MATLKKTPPLDPRLQVDRRALAVLEAESDAELARFLRKPVVPVDPAEIAYARSVGYYEDPFHSSHDEIIERLLRARDRLKPKQVANAFVAGLGKKRPDWRSAIASYAVSLRFPVHEVLFKLENFSCMICQGSKWMRAGPTAPVEIEPNSVRLERHRTGGGSDSQLSPTFAAIDLEQFLALPLLPEPDASDVQALQEMLKKLRSFDAKTTLTAARKAIGSLGGANDMQRQQTIETLSIIGVLTPSTHESFLTRYTPYEERKFPDGKNDWAFPAIAWKGADGVNEKAVKHWFGHLL
jgi:hypothetical protein